MTDVVVPGPQPQLDGRNPAHRLAVAETGVDRVRIALQILERDALAERHIDEGASVARRSGRTWLAGARPFATRVRTNPMANHASA